MDDGDCVGTTMSICGVLALIWPFAVPVGVTGALGYMLLRALNKPN
jgi:hypothetical protein